MRGKCPEYHHFSSGENLCIIDYPDSLYDVKCEGLLEKCRHKEYRNMKRKIDTDTIERCTREILEALGDDPNRPGLIETPKRVAKAYEELFEGMLYTNSEIAEMFDKCFEDVSSEDLVTELDIPIFSTCEHHMLLIYDMKCHVGYIPNGKVIGLSKIARVAEMCSRRLQLQERLGQDIYEVLSEILDTEDIIVVLEGKHGCMTARGIKKPGSITKTACIHGRFKEVSDLRREFYSLLG